LKSLFPGNPEVVEGGASRQQRFLVRGERLADIDHRLLVVRGRLAAESLLVVGAEKASEDPAM